MHKKLFYFKILKAHPPQTDIEIKKVKMKNNYQVGEVLDIKGKRAIVKIGQLPMNIDLVDLVVVEKILTNP